MTEISVVSFSFPLQLDAYLSPLVVLLYHPRMSPLHGRSRVIVILGVVCLLSASVAMAKKDADVCSASGSNFLLNSAFVFVKPHANTPATRDLVREMLTKAGIEILLEQDIGGESIDKNGYIDQHYYSIASKATILPASKIPVPAEKFELTFGESWNKVLKEKRACNAMEACERFECTPDELNVVWQKAATVKFGGGFYCAKISVNEKPELYVFNAFFMAMRAKFVGDNSIHCYVVEWDPSTFSWSAFRNDILGYVICSSGIVRAETYS
jgi:hypothetical protein